MKVRVFSFESCPYCVKVKRYLDSRGVEYEVHDIELNEEDAKECLRISGDLTVPVTTIDDVSTGCNVTLLFFLRLTLLETFGIFP